METESEMTKPTEPVEAMSTATGPEAETSGIDPTQNEVTAVAGTLPCDGGEPPILTSSPITDRGSTKAVMMQKLDERDDADLLGAALGDPDPKPQTPPVSPPALTEFLGMETAPVPDCEQVGTTPAMMEEPDLQRTPVASPAIQPMLIGNRSLILPAEWIPSGFPSMAEDQFEAKETTSS